MTKDKRLITDIYVGKRHRRDYGDIDQLAAFIADVGLYAPCRHHARREAYRWCTTVEGVHATWLVACSRHGNRP